MGTTPRLGAAATAKPTTSKRGMTIPPKQHLDQLECMASLSDPVNAHASPPLTSLMMIHEMSKTSMVMVQTMFIIISTNVRCGTQTLNRS